MDTPMYLIQPIDAGHDGNGNPLRAFIVRETYEPDNMPPDTRTTARHVGTYDEGYRGRHAVPVQYGGTPRSVWLPALLVTPAQYRDAIGAEGDGTAART